MQTKYSSIIFMVCMSLRTCVVQMEHPIAKSLWKSCRIFFEYAQMQAGGVECVRCRWTSIGFMEGTSSRLCIVVSKQRLLQNAVSRARLRLELQHSTSLYIVDIRCTLHSRQMDSCRGGGIRSTIARLAYIARCSPSHGQYALAVTYGALAITARTATFAQEFRERGRV